jgi:hypothetical protein
MEAKTTHTPGPWEVGKDGHGKDGWVYCDDATGSAIANTNVALSTIPQAQRAANAALIAAAPELYEALKELVELKAMSDANGPRAVYEERKPIAWENARAALSRVDQGKEQGGE